LPEVKKHQTDIDLMVILDCGFLEIVRLFYSLRYYLDEKLISKHILSKNGLSFVI